MTYATKKGFDFDEDVKRINNLLTPVSLGLFDSLLLSSPYINTQKKDNYPPYNIKKIGDIYLIEIAIAGFSKDSITVEYKDRQLTVTGSSNVKEKDDNVEYIFTGIANRSFTRTFTLGDRIVVESADLKDGMLIITCVQLIPEHLKPKSITINLSNKDSETGGDQRNPVFLAEDK